MPPLRKKAKKAEVEKSDSSSSEDSHDEKNEVVEEPKPKPAKKTDAKDTSAASSCVHRSGDIDGCPAWKLEKGKERAITISDFKGRTYVNVRDFYEKGGKLLPGKGISLTVDQWKVLGECFADVNAVLAKGKA